MVGSRPCRVESKIIIGNCCFSTMHTWFRNKRKTWLARKQNNIAEWSDLSIRGVLYKWTSGKATITNYNLWFDSTGSRTNHRSPRFDSTGSRTNDRSPRFDSNGSQTTIDLLDLTRPGLEPTIDHLLHHWCGITKLCLVSKISYTVMWSNELKYIYIWEQYSRSTSIFLGLSIRAAIFWT
jgi:hypothetical protein